METPSSSVALQRILVLERLVVAFAPPRHLWRAASIWMGVISAPLSTCTLEIGGLCFAWSHRWPDCAPQPLFQPDLPIKIRFTVLCIAATL
jgi:hypothetical protein